MILFRHLLVIPFWILLTDCASLSSNKTIDKLDPILTEKPGRCPTNLMDKSLCHDDVTDQCHDDSECHGTSKCCSTGCAKVCVQAMTNSCELSRENTIRRGRSLGIDEKKLALPECGIDGTFAPIQCLDGICFCVNTATGFELGGTRARSLELVNCSNPKPCAGYQCRMLCPFDFDLDEEGCPLCQCRDPCRDVTCPSGNSCVMEEAECANKPCPPLPTCKQPRSLSSLCTFGDPLMVDETSKRPFLCGTDPGKPSCPTLYKCHVSRGHDYGVCCANVDELVKPGTCPADRYSKVQGNSGEQPTEDPDVRCGVNCDHDLQCPSTQKCCMSSVCGQHCVQPSNLTACLQQRMIAELLIVSEHAGKGYIPQCRDSDGLFLPKQCSRNGFVCWCVDESGRKKPRTVGAAHEVFCQDETAGIINDSVMSSNETSPETDSTAVEIASVVSELGTNDTSTCPLGNDHLTVGGVVVSCSDSNPCPFGYVCTLETQDDKQLSYCCPHANFIETDSKPGQCPFIPYGDKVICSPENRCQEDLECPSNAKCCTVPDCGGTVCIEAIPPQNFSLTSHLLESPTMCEYLRDLVQLEGVSLALPVPKCDKNGAYQPVQCNALGQCWCVDDFGSPIPGTKVSSKELVNCNRLEMSSCSEVTCRLGCDYGFVLDPETACPVCECRNPCNNVDCGVLHECQLVDVPCIDGICPPIPQCVQTVQQRESSLKCPQGEPYKISGKNLTLSCSSRARAMECPIGYSCIADGNSVEGICCPSPVSSEKPGQCPYLMPKESESCDLECSEDAHCSGEEKCCSNGCGTHCLPSVEMTACQHQRTLLEYRAREAGISSDKVFLPQCDIEGSFIPTQCHPGTLTCWCVDPQGIEVAGTRVSSPAKPNCQKPLVCPAMNCNLACLHGYQLNSSGCPICACRDPCEEVTCSSTSEECRIVHVACVGEPCPPLPVCLPKLENPCPTGSPLTVNDTLVECGPQGQSCPSSHKCHLSPLGEYALCCPKPRDVCYHDRDPGVCEGSIQRWHFNADKNRCERFRYGGCGGNLNNFDSEEECRRACPKLTSCQKIRRKNFIFAEKDKKITFLPKCDKVTGEWLPEQCLEELGVCWCVTPTGDQVPQTLTRGAPTCQKSSRSGRLLNLEFDPSRPTNMICEAGQTVHMCDKSICENKVCLSHPGAVCRVNPCGGCSFQFVDGYNAPVDCEVGLTDCQKQLQNVLNSPAFERPNRILTDVDSKLRWSSDDMENVYQQTEDEVFADDIPVAGVNIHSTDNTRFKRQAGLKTTLLENPVFERGLVDPTDIDVPDTKTPPLNYQDINGDDYENEKEPPAKPGTCPSLMKDFSLLQCNPTRDCSIDAECPGDSKCCFTGCGTICLQPTESPISLGMILEAPQCHSDGSWVREQRSGDLTWCVDTKGRPMHETLTRGHVRCGPNGQILEQMSIGYVCPKGIRPMVCTDECEHAVCSTHPDSVCIADPCNQCQVSFYSSNGEQINCEDKCSQPPSAGMCRASFKRYFYNSSANECQEFIYGGCQGNDNNYPSKEICESECGEKALTCDQPVRVGHCNDGEARWYYNKNARKCELFLYSGCGANDNNFHTKEACENTCPDLILCPYWSVSSMEPAPCSRSAACLNQTCHGYPETICKVDPCTCTAHFYNLDGERVTCMMPTESPKTRLSFTYEEESSSTSANVITNEISTDKKGSVTIFLEGEPTLTRCELLQRHLRQTNSRRYIAQCDEIGRFIPTQCYSPQFIESFLSDDRNDVDVRSVEAPNCWCVDEIGRKTQPTVYFRKGERSCDVVSVESVIVTLGFRKQTQLSNKFGKGNEQEIKKQVRMLLKHLSAETLEDDINIINLPEITQVKFTLLGTNKVDVAYQLEDQVRRGGLALRLKNEVIPADLRASWFHHQVSEPRWSSNNQMLSASRIDETKPSPREVVSEAVVLAPPYLAVTVVFTVISAILVCALVISVVLYRRHATGQYPKNHRGSLQSLAFSDTSLDRRSTGSRFSDTSRRYSLGSITTPPPPIRRQNITTIEEEYRAAMH